ncbi:MAG: hypothetical protein M1324_00640 [Patescibacteria group bacterium]|nr:hypothetical protein [Patescibacteria group bacterium]
MKKEISTTKGLIAIFGAAVILFGAAMTYYVRMAPTTYDYEIQGSTVAKKTTASTATATDATKDWKTYTNSKYGFSFKYPNDWSSPEAVSSAVAGNRLSMVTKNTNKDAAITIEVLNNTYSSISDWVSAKNNIEGGGPKFTEKNITVGGIAGKELNESRGLTTNIGIIKDSYIFTISLVSEEASKTRTVDNATYRNILSTFQFITPTNTTTPATSTTDTTTAAWKSYKNTDYGFGLTFTDPWEGYKMKAVDLEGTVKTFYVNVPTKDPLYVSETSTAYAGYAAPFAIGVIEKSKWQDDEIFARDFGSKVGEKGDYIFTSSQWQACPTDLCSSDITNSLKIVMDSFTVL